MRDSFVFYRSYYEAIAELDDDTQLKIYQALCDYSLNGAEPNLAGVAKAVFTLIKPTLEANRKRYENGKKGGKPNQIETKNEPNANQSVTKTKPNINQTLTKAKPNVNVNDNVNVNVNENIPPKSPKGDLQERFNAFWEVYPRKVAKQAAIKAWEKIKPDAELTKKIVESVKSQCHNEQWHRDNGQYIPYPTTWLNRGEWDNETVSVDTAKPDTSYDILKIKRKINDFDE